MFWFLVTIICYHHIDRIAHTTAFVEHWLEWEIVQWVHHEGSIQHPIAPWANTLTTELHLAPFNYKVTEWVILKSLFRYFITAAKPNLIRFGDCYITEPRTLTFSMTNHSKTDSVRFQWPDHEQLKFSPQVGHLHAGASKDFSITFKSESPHTMTEHPVQCIVMRITFDKPVDQVILLSHSYL